MFCNEAIKANIDWIKSGKIGCVFASALVKQANKIGWKFYSFEERTKIIDDIYTGKVFVVSIVFPNYTKDQVRDFAIHELNMYVELIGKKYEGLRMKLGKNVSWVQYFGPDSHVKTRQSPYPMLCFTVQLPVHIYAKTMVLGIYHLAHASIQYLTPKKAHTLWNQSYAKTKKELGYVPTLENGEAAKVTFAK